MTEVSYAGLILKLEEAVKRIYPALEDLKDWDAAQLHCCEAQRLLAHLNGFLVTHREK